MKEEFNDVVEKTLKGAKREEKIKSIIKSSNILSKYLKIPKEELKILKVYIINDLMSIKKQTEEQKKQNTIGVIAVKSCLEENYDYLTYMLNCKYRVDRSAVTSERDFLVNSWNPICSGCKLKNCIKSISYNFIYEIDRLNEQIQHDKENKTNEEQIDLISYMEVLDILLNENNDETKKKKKTNKDLFSKVDFYDLLFVLVLLESDLIRLEEYDDESKIAKFQYVGLESRNEEKYYINKLLEYFAGNKYELITLDLGKIKQLQNNIEETKGSREKIIKIACYYKYLMEIENIDIISELNSFIEKDKVTTLKARAYYYYERYKNKVEQLPYNKKAKDKIIELFNYIINHNYIGNTPFIPINIVIYSNDKESVEKVRNIIGEYMWFFGYLPENMRYYDESMNNLILDKYLINKLYLTTVNDRVQNKRGVLTIHNFANIMYTEEINRNLILNILTEQIERNNNNVCTIIYGSKEEIQPILMNYPKLRNILFNIELEIDELDIDSLKDIVINKLNTTEKVNSEIEEGILNYLKSTYTSSEIKNMEYINKLYNSIILNINKTMNINTNRKIQIEDIPEGYNIRNLPEVLKDLNDLVGLEKIKNQINDLIYLLKFNKKVNIDITKINLHMFFTGNPGTGKTTVARLISDILYNLGYVQQNKLVEVSAKDLIANYVGQTPGKTFSILKSAFGGVLFIDEAYSIVSQENRGSFGDECIATIIKVMEDYKDKLVIIFAGYEKEMEEFIKYNAGLTSRVGYRIKFEDYTTDELMEILDGLVSKNNLTIEEDAREEIRRIVYESSKIENFGNARFINKLFQNILIEHAKNTDLINDEKDLFTIKLSDINSEKLMAKDSNKRKIGF